MKKEIISRIYRKADADLARARNELFKPEEDVVYYSSCVSARSAMYHFLGCLSVIEKEKADINSIENGLTPMDQLVREAGKKFPEVANMDFSSVECQCMGIQNLLNDEETHFCNNSEMVTHCTNLADQLKEIVLKRTSQVA